MAKAGCGETAEEADFISGGCLPYMQEFQLQPEIVKFVKSIREKMKRKAL